MEKETQMGIFFRTGRGTVAAEVDRGPQQQASSPTPASFGQVAGVFLLAVAGTALLVGLDLLVPGVTRSGLQQNAERLAIVAVILWGTWLALTRAGYAGRARLTAWSAVAVPLLVWQSLIWWLAVEGAPLLPAAVVLPLLIGLPLLLWPRPIGRLLDTTPPAWLVGLQVYRIFGSIWLVGWLAGSLPAVFALPAGVGDTLVGLLALPVALLLRARARGSRGLAVGWNLFGILDGVNAITLGVLATAAGALQLGYPLVLIPAFGIPLSLLLHPLSLRQLRRATRLH